MMEWVKRGPRGCARRMAVAAEGRMMMAMEEGGMEMKGKEEWMLVWQLVVVGSWQSVVGWQVE